ncbi:MAG: hypothetical protein QOJ70_3247, partial [Acidobacteriota bacterium]|nr:hypothetical protein [Acidobacteriota bacterium]
TFVPAPKALIQSAINNDATQAAARNDAGAQAVNVSLDISKAGSTAPVVNNNNASTATKAASVPSSSASAPVESAAELQLLPEQQELKVGERRRVMVFLKTDAPLGLAAATLRFDPKALAVRSVSQGGLVEGDKSLAPVVTQSIDASGVLVVSVAPAAGARPLTGEGLLFVIEVEGLAPGETALQFDADKVHFIATDGRAVRPRTTPGRLKVTQ